MSAIHAIEKRQAGATVTVPVQNHLQVLLTEAEVTRRVCGVIDNASQQRDFGRLRELTRVYENLGSVTPTSVILESSNPVELSKACRWVKQSFGDCCAEPIFYLVCAGAPSAMDISEKQKVIAQACSIPMERMARPIYLPNEHGTLVGNAITAQIKYESRSLAQLIIALRAHLKSRAQKHFASQGDRSEPPPVRRQVDLYLAWLLSQCDQSDQSPSTAPAYFTPREVAAANMPTLHGVSPDLGQALSNRLALYQRKFAHQPQDSTLGTESRMRLELQTALSGSDPLDVAAVACLMWDVGIKVTQPQPAHPPRATAGTAGEQVRAEEGAASAKTATAPQAIGELLLTTAELAPLIKYDERTIRELLVKKCMEEGVHYIRPFGRKILFRWAKVAQLLGIDPGVAGAK